MVEWLIAANIISLNIAIPNIEIFIDYKTYSLMGLAERFILKSPVYYKMQISTLNSASPVPDRHARRAVYE